MNTVVVWAAQAQNTPRAKAITVTHFISFLLALAEMVRFESAHIKYVFTDLALQPSGVSSLGLCLGSLGLMGRLLRKTKACKITSTCVLTMRHLALLTERRRRRVLHAGCADTKSGFSVMSCRLTGYR